MRFRTAISALVFATIALLSGCTDLSPDALINRAEQAFAEKRFNAAVIDLKAVLRANPNHARARWLLGELYLETQDGASAEKEFRRAASLGVSEDGTVPQVARALLLQHKIDDVIALTTKETISPRASGELAAAQAAAYLLKKDEKAAEQRLATAKQLAPESTYVRYVEALSLLLEGQKKEAKAIVQSILENDSTRGEAWALLGDIHRSEGSLVEAEEAYTKAIANRFVNLDERIKRTQVRVALSNFDAAFKDVQVLLKQAPKSAQVQRIAGILYFQREDYQNAEEKLSLAHDGNPNDIATLFFLATTETLLGNQNQSRQLAEQLVAAQPRFVPGRKLLAILQIRAGDGQQAEALLRPVVNALPHDQEAKKLLATSLLMRGSREEASAIFDELASNQPGSASAQLRAGVGQIGAGDIQRGIETLSSAATLAPDDPDVISVVVGNLLQQRAMDDALASSKRFADTQPNNPRALNLLAGVYLARQETDRAIETLNRVLEQAPGDPAASIMLANIEKSAGNSAKASSLIQAALDRHPDDLQLLMQRAEAALTEKRTAQALSLLERAMTGHPKELAPRLTLARVHLANGEPTKVLEVLGDADPRDERVVVAKADAYYRLDQKVDAKRELEQLVILRPDYFPAHFQLAKIDADLGDLPSTERHLVAALQIAPDDPRALLARVRLLALRGKVNEAQRMLSEAPLAADDPELEATRLYLAQQTGNTNSQLSHAEKLYEMEPDANNAVTLSSALINASRPDEAEAVLQSQLAKDPTNLFIRSQLATLYSHRGKDDEAIRQLRKIVEARPNDMFALNNLAWLLRKTSPDEALTFAKRAVEDNPRFSPVLDTYAALLSERGDHRSALRVINDAIANANDANPYRIRRAEIYFRSGDQRAATEDLELVLHSSPKPVDENNARRLLSSAGAHLR
ncbi:MAG: PEP-CTERM system TPR-repeat protein PrsT [Gammaproteobacteria bacterium]|nr:PEP-CTERM system TPR-repeat protein PrsT [Gammaproteobacteria bacterium]